MSTHNICFHGEIRKMLVVFGRKKKKEKEPYWELWGHPAKTFRGMAMHFSSFYSQNLVLEPQSLGARVLCDAYINNPNSI